MAGQTFSSVSLGERHSCARGTNNTVTCWGANDHGQLGDGTYANSPGGVLVPGITDAALVAVGGSTTCVVRSTNDELDCWGDNSYGQLGTGYGWVSSFVAIADP